MIEASFAGRSRAQKWHLRVSLSVVPNLSTGIEEEKEKSQILREVLKTMTDGRDCPVAVPTFPTRFSASMLRVMEEIYEWYFIFTNDLHSEAIFFFKSV